MKVTVGPIGQPVPKQFVLADHGVTTVADFRFAGQRTIEVVDLIRAADVRIFDRKNRRSTVTFRVSREHDSHAAAEQFIFDHEMACPATGMLTIECITPSGARKYYYIRGVGIEVVEATYKGSTTFHTYNIVGGMITKTKPTL